MVRWLDRTAGEEGFWIVNLLLALGLLMLGG